MPVQIDQLDVVDTPPAEPAARASVVTPTVDLSDQLRSWERARACRSDRLRAD